MFFFWGGGAGKQAVCSLVNGYKCLSFLSDKAQRQRNRMLSSPNDLCGVLKTALQRNRVKGHAPRARELARDPRGRPGHSGGWRLTTAILSACDSGARQKQSDTSISVAFASSTLSHPAIGQCLPLTKNREMQMLLLRWASCYDGQVSALVVRLDWGLLS